MRTDFTPSANVPVMTIFPGTGRSRSRNILQTLALTIPSHGIFAARESTLAALFVFVAVRRSLLPVYLAVAATGLTLGRQRKI